MATSTITPPPGYSVESSTQPQASSLPEGYQVEGQAQPESFGHKVVNAIGDTAVGMVKGASQALLPGPKTAAAINNILGTNIPSTQDPRLEGANTAEKVGKTAEDIGEFVSGDEALKSLSLGKRAMEAAGLAEKYEKASPFVKAAIEHTMNAVRQGTVGATQQAVKTGDLGAAAAAGGTAAASNLVVGPALDLAGEGLKYIGAAKQLKDLAPNLDKAITSVVSKSAEADGLKPTAGATAFENLADSAQQYQARAKAGYQVVDNAVDGELQPLQDKLQQTKKAIKLNSNLNPDLADKLTEQQGILQKQLAATIEKAKANGVPDADKIIQKADADYTKFRAQSDLSTRLQKAAGAGGPASPAGLHIWTKQTGTPKVVGQLSRMDQALGKNGAEAVKNIAAAGRAKGEELAGQAAIGSAIKKAAIGAVGIGAGGEVVHRALSQ